MPVEMGMWRIDGETPKRLTSASLPTEATLEAFLERDPSLLGERLLVIGRQVHTPHGKYIDLLAMDAEGNDYDRLFWPHRDGLIWPHWRLAGVVVTV